MAGKFAGKNVRSGVNGLSSADLVRLSHGGSIPPGTCKMHASNFDGFLEIQHLICR